MRSKSLLLTLVGSLLCAASSCGVTIASPIAAANARPFDGTLSVLTYNIEGLPWPFTHDRPPAFLRMADRLETLRRAGRNPQIVVLQEAFSDAAQAIGRAAGYRYIVEGPTGADVDAPPPNPGDERFEAEASWSRGEGIGRPIGSGLMLLSDYPILRVRRMAYPAYACAGYDCLASKGALLVTVRIPGAPAPVDIVTTHLNCRSHTGVGFERALQAFRRETGFLSAFINRWHDPADPMIVAGDFNTGRMPQRWVALRQAIASWRGGAPFQDAIGTVARQRLARGAPLPGDIRSIIHRNDDWQFFTSGRNAALGALAVRIPFGHEPDGTLLSDHIGYTALYRLSPAANRSAG